APSSSKKGSKDTSVQKKKGSKNESNGAANEEANEESKYNSFHKFTKLCEVIASVSKYTDKSSAVKMFISRDDFDGDILTLVRLLIPGVDQRVYNIKEKQIIKHFATIYDLPAEELLDSYKIGGDVSKTIRDAIEKNNLSRTNKGNWSIQKVDRWLTKLTEFTKDDEQINHLKFAAKRYKKRQLGNVAVSMEVGIRLGTPAEPCKSVQQAMKRCVNGMFAEIKYDGERVQVHKTGTSFSFYSRSLKPVQHHKISHFEKVIPKAFPAGLDLIIDAEVLLVDKSTGKPLPFGTLGVHKKEQVICFQ
ncbi:ATP-dependent DNA ligase domain protein, partial [Cooperia oncophora]